MEDPVERSRSDAPLRGWIDRVVVPQEGRSTWFAVVVVCAGFALCYGVTAMFGSHLVSTTWYVPFVLLAAARFRYVGALVASVVAMLLSGPMRPAVDAATAQQPPVWIGRGLVFALVGVVTAGLIDRIVAHRERELGLAEQERDFAIRQAAVIATVSHEFRTPLTVITGVARTLEVHGMVTGEGESLLTGLMDAARRLTDLVNTVGAVMDGSPDQTFVRLEPIVLRDVMDHVLDHLGVRDPRNRVSVHIDPHAEIFISDRELLSQLMRHVIENAVKFSPADQQVEVRVHREDGRLEVQGRRPRSGDRRNAAAVAPAVHAGRPVDDTDDAGARARAVRRRAARRRARRDDQVRSSRRRRDRGDRRARGPGHVPPVGRRGAPLRDRLTRPYPASGGLGRLDVPRR